MKTFVYNFQFSDGSTESFPIPAAETPAGDLPAWTELGFHQCSNCPLSTATTSHCPMAVQLVKLIDVFGKRTSYEKIVAHVESAERSVSKATTVQRAIGSLMGLLTAASDCPHVSFLKPMVHFHLPFSTEEETIYRVASMHLLTQYFVRRKNGQPDWNLVTLKANYLELQHVNKGMAKRLRTVGKQDGAINALILLDLFAKALPFSIDEALEGLQPVFEQVLSKQIKDEGDIK